MKAVVLHEYGGLDKLKYEDVDDPQAGPGEVLIKVSAVSINPIDYKMRSGAEKDQFPVQFPGILGRDVAGVIRAVGECVTQFSPGDKVFALADKTYAELCVVKASSVAHIPEGMDMVQASALPLVTATGEQLIRLGTGIEKDQTVLIAGAIGSVGRAAVWCAQQVGAHVIAGVRKSQLDEARSLGVDRVVALDDADAIDEVNAVDAVADTVGGETAEMLLGKVRPGGRFGSVLASPTNAALNPTVKIVVIGAHPDPRKLEEMAKAVLDGGLQIPVVRTLHLAAAGEGQAAAEKGESGKVVLVP
jgi:NADPH:quinone reductase-like Zn-dependent oxidoreductase